MKKYFKWVKPLAKWNKFHLADKCLLIIMVILMIQMAHNLFLHEIAMQESAIIDVVIRTTAAAIFGYFISGNFCSGNKDILNNKNNTNSIDMESSSDISSVPKARIGFSTAATKSELYSGYAHSDEDSESAWDDKAQIIIIAAIGIVCLIFLLIVRNYSTTNTASVATLSQLRDFISGSVGFLIGQSTQNKKTLNR